MRHRNRTHLAVGVAPALLLAVVLSACGDDIAASPTVRESWAIAVNDEAATVYLTLTAAEDDELVAARVDRSVAARVDLVNASDDEDDPGHLGHLDPGGSLGPHGHTVTLPADRPVMLEPGGAYLALSPLTKPLSPGETIPVSLSFRDAPDLKVEVTVRTGPP